MIDKNKINDMIQEAKEIIGDDAIPIIADHLNIHVENNRASCPFHEDDTPSFIWNPRTKYFKCFGCSRVYSILDYLVDVKGSYKEAVNELFKMAHMEYDLYNYKPFDADRIDWFKNYVYPHPEKEPTENHVIKYLHNRGISKEIIEYAGIKEDKYGNVAFEHRDLDGKLLCTKYHVSHKLKDGEKKFWWQKDSSHVPILYNVMKLDYTKPLLIVEGHWDCLACIEAGYTNVCSIPDGANNPQWIEFNYDFLENFDSIILWFDNDEAGKSGIQKTLSRIGEYRCKLVKPTNEDEDNIENYYESYGRHGIRKTDANNILLACGGKRLLDLIERAEDVPVKNLKYLMDCENQDVNDIEKTSTGLKGLDDLLYGNLKGCLTIYTGVAGSGKSSICNLTSVISPIESGKKVFIFSGELSDGQLLNWIVSPLAGINNTIVWDNNGGRKGFSVTSEAETAIRRYYHDDIILYSDVNQLETNEDSLLQAMEVAYRKYNCEYFLIDNLMSISFDNTSDSIYENQKRYFIKLMNFVNQYQVTVNTIVHPRKGQNGDNKLDIYSLNGSSNLSNLCHRLIAVSRLSEDPEGYSMEIEVIKDRPSQAAGKKCKLMYDYCTRRIYSTNDELEHKFSWEEGFSPNYSDNTKRNLICNRPDILDSIPKIIQFNPDEDCDQY